MNDYKKMESVEGKIGLAFSILANSGVTRIPTLVVSDKSRMDMLRYAWKKCINGQILTSAPKVIYYDNAVGIVDIVKDKV